MIAPENHHEENNLTVQGQVDVSIHDLEDIPAQPESISHSQNLIDRGMLDLQENISTHSVQISKMP